MRLDAFFDRLDEYPDSVPLEKLVAMLRGLELSRDDVEHAIAFDDHHYKRNMLHYGGSYAALILCWKDGQASPIHDHQGSACGVYVVDGTGFETKYFRGKDGQLVEGPTTTFCKGEVCGSFDSDIHVLYNNQGGGRDLVTLHIYTPPLKTVHTYCAQTGAVKLCEDKETAIARREFEAALR